jgi:C_GCAxxG_C_C family probable redox protein
MTRHEVEERAFSLHRDGFICSEAVLTAMAEHFGLPSGETIPAVATCFGGGVGRTKQELCGALAGGLMAVGCLRGRSVPGEDWSRAAELAAEFRKRFLETFGSTACQDILTAFGEQDNMMRCKRLSGQTAGILFELLETR